MKTDKEIDEENKLIAGFDGIQIFDTYQEMQTCPIDQLRRWSLIAQLKYHKSWSELMPVVEKIDQLYHEKFPPGPEFVRRILAHEKLGIEDYTKVIALPLATPIEEVYQAVVEFIKWYNQQPKQSLPSPPKTN